MICQCCGSEYADGLVSCPYCGTSSAESLKNTGIACPNCGAQVLFGQPMCQNCGTLLQRQTAPSDFSYCPECGNAVPRSEPVCRFCGHEMKNGRRKNSAADQNVNAGNQPLPPGVNIPAGGHLWDASQNKKGSNSVSDIKLGVMACFISAFLGIGAIIGLILAIVGMTKSVKGKNTAGIIVNALALVFSVTSLAIRLPVLFLT